jgi:hypothetical protein
VSVKRAVILACAVVVGQLAVAGALGGSGHASPLGWCAAILGEVVGAAAFLTLVAPKWQTRIAMIRASRDVSSGRSSRMGATAALSVLIGTALAMVFARDSAAGVIAGVCTGAVLGLLWWTPTLD